MISANRAARLRDTRNNLQSHMVKTSGFQSPKALKVKYFFLPDKTGPIALVEKKNQPLSN